MIWWARNIHIGAIGHIKAKGLHPMVILKNNMKAKNHDLDRWITKLRSPYERTFSKQNQRTRYTGIAKNQAAEFLYAIAYDERSKWNEIAVMMPYSKKGIIISKYFSMLGAATLVIAVQLVMALIGHGNIAQMACAYSCTHRKDARWVHFAFFKKALDLELTPSDMLYLQAIKQCFCAMKHHTDRRK